MAHAAADAGFARELGSFLETGCNVSVFHEDGVIGPGEDLISIAENGLSADILVLVLSPASNLPRWVRERWEPVLSVRAKELGTRVAVVMLEECAFPGLLRRGGHFFDASERRIAGLRRLKRWIWGLELGTEPAMSYSADLETLYADVADQIGTVMAGAGEAQRFAHEASRDFEAVLWIPAHQRTLAQVAGAAGEQLGLRLAGPVEEDCKVVREVLAKRRCLLILDAPTLRLGAMIPEVRTSVLITSEPAMAADEGPSVSRARRLAAAGRVSEAYEDFHHLYKAGVEPEACARELVWIYEQWDRMEEANQLRFQVGPAPAEQLRLF